MGRPSIFTQEIADTICERLSQDESLASICRDEGMPTTTTVFRWRAENEQFRDDYARAREEQGHYAADVVGEIRRGVLAGEIDPKAGRAAADMAKWEASRRASKDFGDKIEQTHRGGVTLIPMQPHDDDI